MIGGPWMATAQRRAREKAEKRREILQAAKEVFFQKGVHRATMDDVAARAEVAKGTLYLYFQSKEEILAHLLLEGLSILLDRLEAAYAPQERLPAEERIRRLARAYLDFSRAYPDHFRLLMAFDRGRFRERVPTELYQKVFEGSMRGLELVAKAMREGMEAGSFEVDDPWRVAGVLWAALHGVLVLMAHPLRRQMLSADLDSMFEATLDLFLQGIRAD